LPFENQLIIWEQHDENNLLSLMPYAFVPTSCCSGENNPMGKRMQSKHFIQKGKVVI
jgi:hypothetical protein